MLALIRVIYQQKMPWRLYMPGVIHLTCMGIDPGVLYWTLGSGASACHAEPIPLFAMKLARALAGRPIRALRRA